MIAATLGHCLAAGPTSAAQSCNLDVGSGSLLVPDVSTLSIRDTPRREGQPPTQFQFETEGLHCHFLPEISTSWPARDVDDVALLDAFLDRERQIAVDRGYDSPIQRSAERNGVLTRAGQGLFIARTAHQRNSQLGDRTRFHTKAEYLVRFARRESNKLGPFAYCVFFFSVPLAELDLPDLDAKVEGFLASYGPDDQRNIEECPK